MDTNVVVISGHLTKAAELKYWTDQTAYCEFCVATNESYKDKQTGEWKDIPSYFDCAMRGKFAESYAKHLVKGRGVTVQGKLKQNRWESEGQKFSRVIVKVSELKLEKLNQNTSQQPAQQNYQPENNYGNNNQTQQNGYQEGDFVPFDESSLSEDIPF